jgi:hypothetical protein
MRFIGKTPLLGLLTLLLLSFGCTSKEYVRHLNSDASLITPQQSTKQDINAYLGPPDKKQPLANGSEEWTYFQQNKSLLRKTPYVGAPLGLGSEHYDVMVIVFHGEIVDTCQYRMFTKEEFDKSHIDSGPKPDAN